MKAWKGLMLAAVAVAVLGAAAYGQDKRYVDPSGEFSIQAPAGWIEGKSAKGKVAFQGPIAGGTAPTLILDRDEQVWDLVKYSDNAITHLIAGAQELKIDAITLESKADFTTASGLKCVRASLIITAKGKTMRVTQYYIPGKENVKFLMTFSARVDDKEVNDKIFDDSVKSFRLEK